MENNTFRRITPEDEFLGIAKRKLLPLMTEIMDPSAPKELEVKDEQLYINGVPVGEWRLICQYSRSDMSDRTISFRYGHNLTRYIHFGSSAFSSDPDRVVEITESSGDQDYRTIYSEL